MMKVGIELTVNLSEDWQPINNENDFLTGWFRKNKQMTIFDNQPTIQLGLKYAWTCLDFIIYSNSIIKLLFYRIDQQMT